MKVLKKKTGIGRSICLVELTVGRDPKDGSKQTVYRWHNVMDGTHKNGLTIKLGVHADDVGHSEHTETLARVHDQHPWIASLPAERVARAQRAMLLVERVVGVVALCVPRRIVNEEIGDACEVIAEHFRRSSALWPAYVKLVTTVFWIVAHAIGYFTSQLRGSKRASGE
ncbi:hypothetical protein [Sorangium sp. So ce117]|uniref:hypothetical protein n=1 Tax=Sorangium sp. So ce117 TaxID=3133277 RepID=UPI003F5F7F68